MEYSNGTTSCECFTTFTGDTCSTQRGVTSFSATLTLGNATFTDDLDDPESVVYTDLEERFISDVSVYFSWNKYKEHL